MYDYAVFVHFMQTHRLQSPDHDNKSLAESRYADERR